jgi:16S rRNA (guanine527-N7)-methyltransferase
MSFSEKSWLELDNFLVGLGVEPGLSQSEGFKADCLRFLELLLKKNESLNLTAIRDPEAAFWKHLADSLALLSLEPLGDLVDWGSGGGFPGIPLALARKWLGFEGRVVFVDSVGKKIRAVEEFCQALGLKDVSFLVGRGENLSRSGGLRGVKSVVMRAVAPPERAARWLDPRIPQWIFFAGPMQMAEWQNSASFLRKKGFSLFFAKEFSLPQGHGRRALVQVSTSST